ncbi:hypothetical protein JCM6882_004281 [Rhodosporidiobolus microsporus]
MYRKNSYDDPRGLTRPHHPSSRRSFLPLLPSLSSRSRIHPILLLPALVFGAFLSPLLLGEHGHSLLARRGEAPLPEPVYRPQDYLYKPADVFAEPDAPPLVMEDDAARAAGGRRRVAAGAGGKEGEKVLAREGHGDGADEWEWWDPSSSASGDSDYSPALSGSALTARLYTVHAGLLYFSSSPSTIPSHPHPFPPPSGKLAPAGAAAAVGQRAAPLPPRPKMPDEGLTLPPPPPLSWLAPGELFAHPPGKRKHAIDRSALPELHAPLPPRAVGGGGGAGAGAARQQQQAAAAAARRGAPAGAGAGGVGRNARARKEEKDQQGHRLGPNAAAMARAKREGKPFVPGKPAELVAEERALERRKKAQRDKERGEWAREQMKGGNVWVAAGGQGAGAAGAAAAQKPAAAGGFVAAPVIVAEEEKDDLEEEDDPAWASEDDDELLDLLEGGDDAADSSSADSGVDIDPADDAALLAAIRQLSPAELAELSPAERALVAELEAAEAAGAAAAGRQRGGKQAQEPKQRKHWMDNEPEEVVKGRREAVHAPPPKPVYKGPLQQQQKQKKEKAAKGKGGLRKRAFEAEEVAEEFKEEVLVAAAAVDETTAFPVTADEAPSPSPDSPSNDSPSPSPSSSNSDPSPPPLTKRALAEDLSPGSSSSSSSSGSDKPPPPDRLHPIAHLISRAEEEWDDLLRRQSQTLEQAVAEYEARYGMRPPAGFDAWWRYAMQNRIVLVDEYDQIHSDLLPFFSLPPSELRRRASSLHTDHSLPWHAHSFGLQVRDGAVELMPGGHEGDKQRTEDLLDLLGEFAEMLPDLEVRFASGDEPSVVVSGEAKERHIEYAKKGELLGLSQSYEVLEPTGFTAWDALCPPNSTARRAALGQPVDTPAGSNLRSFVSIEHAQTMDLCKHPEVRGLNGFTSGWTGPRPHVLYPLFSFSKTSLHSDILVPSLSNEFYLEVGRDPVWEQKKKNKVLWRGDTTGAYFARGTGWRQSQRARLVELANPKPDSNSGSSPSTTIHLASPSSDDALRRLTAPSTSLTSHYFDIAFAGSPVQCSKKDKTCALLQHEYRFDLGVTAGGKTRGMSIDEENQYKYVLDVDANYPSGKFKRLMSSRSLVLKSTIFPEWWSKRIMPWYHYVPIKPDYSDLLDVSAFFIGLPDGTANHDHLAKRIGAQGKKWADEQFREVDMAAYLFRLYLEYARLLNRDENNLHSMDYNP